MTLRLIDAPTALAVSVAEAKLHCRIDGSDDDVWLTMAIRAATGLAEHETGRAIMSQTWEEIYDRFPQCAALSLGKPPVSSVVSVVYASESGAAALIDLDDVVLDSVNLPGWLFPAAGKAWPVTYATANAVRVRFVCGYGAASSDVPESIRQWILLQVGAMYRNREAFAQGVSVNELPNRFVGSMLDPYRTYVL